MSANFIKDKQEISIKYFKKTEFPLILSFPHSGRNYKKDFLSQITVGKNELRLSEDMYLDKLFSHCTNMSLNSIFAEFPRVYLDVNRERFEINHKALRDYPKKIKFLDSNLSKSGIGVIHTNSSNGKFFYKGKISWDNFALRLENYYDPWYDSLDKISSDMLNKFSKILILDCHSMPSKIAINDRNSDFDFNIGDYNGSSCNLSIVNFMREYISNLGFKVGYNTPFSGQNILKKFGKPKIGINAIQLEVNKRLYLDEKNFRLKNIEDLQKFNKDLITSLSEYMLFNKEYLNVAE